MIQNYRQYKITQAWAERFERALAELEALSPSGDKMPTMHPVLRAAQASALRSQLADLRLELEAYLYPSTGG